MDEPKPTRFELRLPADLCRRIDEWRRQQDDLPPRAEAARRLIVLALDPPATDKPARGRASKAPGGA